MAGKATTRTPPHKRGATEPSSDPLTKLLKAAVLFGRLLTEGEVAGEVGAATPSPATRPTPARAAAAARARRAKRARRKAS
jgi:hypothetical protein